MEETPEDIQRFMDWVAARERGEPDPIMEKFFLWRTERLLKDVDVDVDLDDEQEK